MTFVTALLVIALAGIPQGGAPPSISPTDIQRLQDLVYDVGRDVSSLRARGDATFAGRLRGAIESAVATEAIFAADGEVIQVGRTRGTTVADGTAFDIPEVHRWTVRAGRVVAAHFAIDTPAMLAALGDT